MSRSRHPDRLDKCPCGRGLIPFIGEKHRGKQVAACPVLEYPHAANEQRERHRQRRIDLRFNLVVEP